MVPNEKSFPRGGTIHAEAKTTDISSNIVSLATEIAEICVHTFLPHRFLEPHRRR